MVRHTLRLGVAGGLLILACAGLADAQISRVSVATNGAEANGTSQEPAISADGRFVAFESRATNLSPDATGLEPMVYVHDRLMGTTERIGLGHRAAISNDGRYVAFVSGAALVPGDTNNRIDVFLYDRQTGHLRRVSMASDGSQANGHSFDPAISGDGRYVAFRSDASNLVPDDTNGIVDVFVHDTLTDRIEQVWRES